MKYLLSLLFITTAILNSNAQVSMQDSLVLVEIYDSLDGPNWTKQENWLQGPVSTWEGVTVNNENKIEGLSFSRAGLMGNMPEAIYRLTDLMTLSMNEPGMTFVINDSIQNWEAMTRFSSTFTKLEGTLASFCGMQSLTELSMASSLLNVALPECLTDLALTRLNIDNMNSGELPLPEFVSNIKTLNNLTLSRNDFTGELPESFCELSAIRFLILSKNNLTGEIPACLNSDGIYNQLMLDENNFSGEVPAEILSEGISILRLENNNFTGTIDDWPTMNSARLELSGNNFHGTFDGNKLVKSQANILRIQNNEFDALINMDGWGRLSTLDVSNNRLTFEDLEGIDLSTDPNFTYAPQKYTVTDTMIDVEGGMDFSLAFDIPGQGTVYQWYKNNEAIMGAINSEYVINEARADDAGDYYCIASHPEFPELDFVSGTSTVEVNVVSTNDLDDTPWQVSPNPVSDVLYITSSEKNLQKQLIRCVDLMGRTYPVDTQFKRASIELYVADLPQGKYWIQLQDGKGVSTIGFVKM